MSTLGTTTILGDLTVTGELKASNVSGGASGDYLPLTGGTLTGALTVPNMFLGTSGPYIYTENNAKDLCIRGGSANDGFSYLAVKSNGVFINNNSVYHAGFKPTAGDIGAAKALTSVNNYWGMTHNDGSTTSWIRTTSEGIIPYQSGGASSLGTSTWPFSNVYANTYYEGGTALSNKYIAKTTILGTQVIDMRAYDSTKYHWIVVYGGTTNFKNFRIYRGAHQDASNAPNMSLNVKCTPPSWGGSGNSMEIDYSCTFGASPLHCVYTQSEDSFVAVAVKGGYTYNFIPYVDGMTVTPCSSFVRQPNSTTEGNGAFVSSTAAFKVMLVGNCYTHKFTSGAVTLPNTDISATRVYNAVWNDYAEFFEKENIGETFEPGDVIVWNKTGVVKSNKPNASNVVGVYSDTFGHIVGGDPDTNIEDNYDKYVPIGLTGRVNVKLIGKINVGDLITTSDIDGVAMKAINPQLGTVIGKALEDKDTQEITRIKMLIMNT